MPLLQIYHWVRQRKNFENWLTFGEVIGKSLVSCFFLTHGVDLHETAEVKSVLHTQPFMAAVRFICNTNRQHAAAVLIAIGRTAAATYWIRIRLTMTTVRRIFPVLYNEPRDVPSKLLLPLGCRVAWWCSGQGVGLATLKVAGSTPGLVLSRNNLGQVVHTHAPPSASSIIWYRSSGGDALRLGR